MILIVYLIENHSHLIKVENHAERACFDMLAIGLDILGPGRFRPGPPRNNATPIDPVSWGFLMPVLWPTNFLANMRSFME